MTHVLAAVGSVAICAWIVVGVLPSAAGRGVVTYPEMELVR